jgi:hypothetical protein
MTDIPAPDPDAPASAADLLTASELPASTAGTPVTGPKIPPFVGDGMPVSDPDNPASIAELLTAGWLPDTITAALMITDPKIPEGIGD